MSFVGYPAKCRAAPIESSETVQEWAIYLHERKEWAQKLTPLSRWAAILVSLVVMLIRGIHEATEPGEPVQSPIASSSAGSVAGGPCFIDGPCIASAAIGPSARGPAVAAPAPRLDGAPAVDGRGAQRDEDRRARLGVEEGHSGPQLGRAGSGQPRPPTRSRSRA